MVSIYGVLSPTSAVTGFEGNTSARVESMSANFEKRGPPFWTRADRAVPAGSVHRIVHPGWRAVLRSTDRQ